MDGPLNSGLEILACLQRIFRFLLWVASQLVVEFLPTTSGPLSQDSSFGNPSNPSQRLPEGGVSPEVFMDFLKDLAPPSMDLSNSATSPFSAE